MLLSEGDFKLQQLEHEPLVFVPQGLYRRRYNYHRRTSSSPCVACQLRVVASIRRIHLCKLLRVDKFPNMAGTHSHVNWL